MIAAPVCILHREVGTIMSAMLWVPHTDLFLGSSVPLLASSAIAMRKQNIGAPLIAVVACLGLAVDLHNTTSASELEAIEKMNGAEGEASAGAVMAYIQGKMDYLATSRPTAVNLFNALRELKEQLEASSRAAAAAATGGEGDGTTPRARLLRVVKEYAEFALDRDREDNRNIGRHGADEILAGAGGKELLTVMTICNTGSLATSDYGTALGVVRAINERGRLGKVVALETRPYNQGSRL